MSDNKGKSDRAYSSVSTDIDIPSEYVKDKNDDTINKEDVWQDSYIYQEYKNRVDKERDLMILIVGQNNSTGTGKTTLATNLADKMDRTDEGFTPDKATPRVKKFFKIWRNADRGSALVADEGQGMADARRATSQDNVDLSQLMAMARFRQVYTIMTMPDAGMLDKRLKKRADIMIVCDDDVKGKGKVYKLISNVLDSNTKVKTKLMDEITWDAMDDHAAYQKLEEQKEQMFNELLEEYLGDTDIDTEDEVFEEIRDRAKNKARELYKDECDSYRDVNNHPDMVKSPRSDNGNWSTGTLSDWLSDLA